MTKPRVSRWPLYAGSFCLVAFFLRLYLLDAQPIWWDEAISIHLSTSSLAQIISDRAAHVHPPLYFVLLKAWAALAGTTAFSVRFFSAWFNTLLIPAAYAFGRRWMGRREALLGALATAISSLNIIYSQEARAYAMLPLVYLALMAVERRIARSEGAVTSLTWLMLSLIEVVGIYLHYTFFFAVAYINLLIVIRIWREQTERVRWLVSQVVVLLLYLPWLIAIFLNWGAVLDDLGAGDPFIEPAPLSYFLRLLWTFQLSGLTGAPGYAPLLVASLIVAALLATVLVVEGMDRKPASIAWYLMACWIIPLAGASLLWQAKPLSHPRYVAIFSVGLLLSIAHLVARLPNEGKIQSWLATLLGAAFVVTNIVSLGAYFYDPHFSKDDTRSVAASIADRAASSDLILVPSEDWSIPYYYQGQGTLEMLRAEDSATAWQRLNEVTDEGMTAFLVGYFRAAEDRRGLIPFAFESSGGLLSRQDFGGMYVRSYSLERAVTQPDLADSLARLGPLHLTGAWIEQGATADTAVTVALGWQLANPTDLRLRTHLRLYDQDGIEWARTIDWLLNDHSLPTELWELGDETVSYHVIPLRPGTPPLTYSLSLGVFWTEDEVVIPVDLLDEAGNPTGQSLPLAQVSLAPAAGAVDDPYQLGEQNPFWQDPVTFTGGLTLLGATVDRAAVAPGQHLFTTLNWHLEESNGVHLTATLGIEQSGISLITETNPVGGRYPTELWQAGINVLEHRRLNIPADSSSGTAEVFLQTQGQRIGLGQVEIDAGERLFTPPPVTSPIGLVFGEVAELLGYDLEETDVSSSEPVVLTLYWRALEGAQTNEYTVFTHILGENGQLVGQHDAQPVQGGRPTTGWIPGEVIIDRHPMTFREEYSGLATIEVGLYDSDSMDRVLCENGEDHLILPSSLVVLGLGDDH